MCDGKEITTLKDILPETSGLNVLFVGKTPMPDSVKAGHYFQGRQGKSFWNMLERYNLLRVPKGAFHDDYLLQNRYGMTDIVKVPRYYGDEPSESEYSNGAQRIIDLISNHEPKVAVFVYKRVLDHLLTALNMTRTKTAYGFNPILEERLNCKLFVFPMSGTPCNRKEAKLAMQSLCKELSH